MLRTRTFTSIEATTARVQYQQASEEQLQKFRKRIIPTCLQCKTLISTRSMEAMTMIGSINLSKILRSSKTTISWTKVWGLQMIVEGTMMRTICSEIRSSSTLVTRVTFKSMLVHWLQSPARKILTITNLMVWKTSSRIKEYNSRCKRLRRGLEQLKVWLNSYHEAFRPIKELCVF